MTSFVYGAARLVDVPRKLRRKIAFVERQCIACGARILISPESMHIAEQAQAFACFQCADQVDIPKVVLPMTAEQQRFVDEHD